MLICLADLAEILRTTSQNGKANPAGRSKSSDLESFRNDTILKAYKPFRIRTYKEALGDHHKSFVFSLMIIYW